MSRLRWPKLVRAAVRRVRRFRSSRTAAPSGSSTRDVVHSYRLILGRDPDPDALLAKAAYPLRQALAILLDSDEFAERVIDPVGKGRPPAVERPIATGELTEWVEAALPISRTGRRRLRSVRTWDELIWTVLADPSFREFPDGSRREWCKRRFLAALLNRTRGGSRCVVGVTETFDGVRVSGWAIDAYDHHRRVQLEVYANGVIVGVGEAAMMRADIRDALAVPGFCGFTIDLSPARLYSSSRRVHIDVREVRTGHLIGEQVLDTALGPRRGLAEPVHAVTYPLEAYAAYHRHVYADHASGRCRAGDGPRFGIVALIDADADRSGLALRSIFDLSYDGWELAVLGRREWFGDGWTAGCLAKHDPRQVGSVVIETTHPTARQLNDAAARTGGDFLLFADRAWFAVDALDHVATALRSNPEAAVVYWDDDVVDQFDPERSHALPRLKNPFDAVWLMQQNYIGNTFAIARRMFELIGGFRDGSRGADHHDLLLRATAGAGRGAVHHVQRVLHSRPAESDASPVSLVGVSEALRHAGWPAAVEPADDVAGQPDLNTLRIKPQRLGPFTATVVIASRDKPDLLSACVASLLATRGSNRTSFGLTVVDHASALPEALVLFGQLRAEGVDVRRYDGTFNWAAINNFGAAGQTCDVLVFLNDDTLVLAPGWCDELCLHATRSDVGAVGTLLRYPDGCVQHAAMLLHGDGAAAHEGLGLSAADTGYLGRLAVARDVTAVTGACLATRRAVFEAHGGFDALNFPVTFNDVDYCVRVREAGLAVRYTPYASFYHLESKSRGCDVTAERRARHERERRIFVEKWPNLTERDPLYNAHFDLHAPPHRRLVTPRPAI